METINLIIYSILVIAIIYLLYTKKPKLDLSIPFKLISTHKDIINYVAYYEEIGWSLLLSNTFLVTFVNNLNLPQEEIKAAKKEYITLIETFIGETNLQVIYIHFGSRDNFIKFLLVKFDMKFKNEILDKLAIREMSKEAEGNK